MLTFDDLENALPLLERYLQEQFPQRGLYPAELHYWYVAGVELMRPEPGIRYLGEISIELHHIDRWKHIYTYGVTFHPEDLPDGTARVSQFISAYVMADGRIIPIAARYLQEENALAIAFADFRRRLVASSRQARAAAFWRKAKEELAAAIWHPRHVERLVELIGWDAVMAL